MYSNYQVRNEQFNIVIAIIKLIVGVGVLYSVCLVVPQAVLFIESIQQQEAEQFKVRVIANSSSAQDQQVKRQVVEEIQAVVNNNVHAEQTKAFYEEVIHNVREKFPSENISLLVGDNLLPPNYQFTRFYPQNNYYSAVFIIGAGRGENWFCAAFPTVCHVSDTKQGKQSTWFFYEKFAKKSEEKLCTNSENLYTVVC